MFLDGCSGLCLVNLSRGWLILGWCCGFEIWDGADGFEICGCANLSGCVCVCVCFFFFLRWHWWMWVCAGGGWSVLLLLVAVVVTVVDVPLLLLLVIIERR